MKTAFSAAAAVLALGLAAVAPSAQAGVGVSISVGQPGFYGQLNIGDYGGRPALYAPRPVWVSRGPVYAPAPPPAYLYVPAYHRAHWANYCGRYSACGRPVYFVRDDWYRQHVAYRPAPPRPYYHNHGYGYGGAPRPPVYGPPPSHGGPGSYPSGPPTMGGPGYGRSN